MNVNAGDDSNGLDSRHAVSGAWCVVGAQSTGTRQERQQLGWEMTVSGMGKITR